MDIEISNNNTNNTNNANNANNINNMDIQTVDAMKKQIKSEFIEQLLDDVIGQRCTSQEMAERLIIHNPQKMYKAHFHHFTIIYIKESENNYQ